MQGREIGRIALAVVVAYAMNALLVGGTEEFFLRVFRSRSVIPASYFVIDLASQSFIELIAGYVCCWIAAPSRREALVTLIALGLLVGAISVASSWSTEPHLYAIALLLVWPPCVWLGWKLRTKRNSGGGMGIRKPG